MCETTRRYAETMHRVLTQEGVETVQLIRKESEDQAISASRVRQLIKDEAYDDLSKLVPATTLNYLRSEQAETIRERMKTYQRRH